MALFVFVAIALLIYSYAIIIFMPKDEYDLGGSRYYGYVNFKNEKKNSIDCIMFGHSNASSGFSPLEIYKQTGITSYVRASAQESAINVETLLKETLKYQKPKVVVLEVDCLYWPNIFFSGSTRQKFIKLIAPFYFHARWKELSVKDFVTLPKSSLSSLKGYALERNVYTCKKPKGQVVENAKPATISKGSLKSFNNIVKICKENNIQLLLTYLPSPNVWTYSKSLAVQNLAEQYNLNYLDLNFETPDFNLDYSSSFYDDGEHLNIKGTTYTMQYFANYLNKTFNLPNHANDESYQDWNNLATLYEQMKNC